MFQVGDRVRVIEQGLNSFGYFGTITNILDLQTFPYWVDVEGYRNQSLSEREIELACPQGIRSILQLGQEPQCETCEQQLSCLSRL